MSGGLLAVSPGPFTTLQDAGRLGWRRFGVTAAGAMDIEALSIANALVGNRLNEAALEFAYDGGEWEVTAASCRIAVAGGTNELRVDGRPLPALTVHTVRWGQRIRAAGGKDAVWGYLAVAGGFAVSPQLGSRATHLRSGIGGLHGGAFAAGDLLPLRVQRAVGGPVFRYREPPPQDGKLRVVLGPQDDYFEPDSIARFLRQPWRVGHQSDRMGYRLEGPALRHANGFNLISDGLAPGAIQVPGAGQPIVLLRDSPTVGGYPKIATLITADLGRLAQQRPGSEIMFQAVEVDAAQTAAAEFAGRIAAISDRLVPLNPPRPAVWLHR